MEVILSSMLQSVLAYILPILAVSLVSFLIAKAKEAWEKAKDWNPSVTGLLEQSVKVAVQAAEQAGAAGLIHDKRAYAFDVAEKWLKARGVTVDIDLIYAAIEAAVWTEFNKEKDASIPGTTSGFETLSAAALPSGRHSDTAQSEGAGSAG